MSRQGLGRTPWQRMARSLARHWFAISALLALAGLATAVAVLAKLL